MLDTEAWNREILRTLCKAHILHHSRQVPIVGHRLLEELRAHDYPESQGSFYPLLACMEPLGWLTRMKKGARRTGKESRPDRAAVRGRRACAEVEARLRQSTGKFSEADGRQHVCLTEAKASQA